MNLSGGAVESLYPGGTEVDYTLTDGVFAVELNNTPYSGTWDGAKLVIEDTEAVKQP